MGYESNCVNQLRDGDSGDLKSHIQMYKNGRHVKISKHRLTLSVTRGTVYAL
jgi:hypothetical protein